MASQDRGWLELEDGRAWLPMLDHVDVTGTSRTLGQLQDGAWIVLAGQGIHPVLGGYGVAPLLPFLELQREAFDAIARSFLCSHGSVLPTDRQFPLGEFLSRAIDWEGGEHWPRMALRWVLSSDAECMTTAVAPAIVRLISDKRRSQALRAEARRALKRLG